MASRETATKRSALHRAWRLVDQHYMKPLFGGRADRDAETADDHDESPNLNNEPNEPSHEGCAALPRCSEALSRGTSDAPLYSPSSPLRMPTPPTPPSVLRRSTE